MTTGECQTRALRDGPTLRRPSAWGELLAALQESRWRQPHPPQLFWAQHRPEQSGRGSFSLKILLPQRPFDQGGKPRGLQNAPGSFLHHLGGLFLQPSSFLPGPSPEGPWWSVHSNVGFSQYVPQNSPSPDPLLSPKAASTFLSICNSSTSTSRYQSF